MAKGKGEDSAKGMSEQFPVGLKVLVVDDDVLCLRIIEQMLRKCMYSVTSCSHASAALNLLRERKGFFDIVLSDVHMPDMDGFKLLEFVGLEMDLPVIMMSGDDRTNIVMRGIRHGACDYLIKPIRTEELQNIWQHVLRKRCNVNKEHGRSRSSEDNNHENDDGEYDSSINERTDGKPKMNKRRKDAEEEDGDMENDDSTMSKKPRVVWSVELHQQFVSAVNHLGIDKAVPKRILELMNVPGLTRENVASHLQKFRQYLKKLSEVSHQQSGLSNPFGAPLEQNLKVGSLGGFDFQALAASGQISPEILASLHADFVSRPTGNSALPLVGQPTILQGSLLASERAALDHYVAYGQPLMKCSSNTSKLFCPTVNSVDSLHSDYGSWPSKDLVNMVAFSNVTAAGEQKGNAIMSLMQHQQQQQRQQLEHHQNQSVLPEPTRLISVQPSCLVASHSSLSIAGGSNLVSANQSCSSNRNGVLEYNSLTPQSICAFGGLSGSGSTSPSVLSCSINASNSLKLAAPYSVPTCAGPSSVFVPNNSIVCGTYGASSSKLVDGLPKNTAIIGRGTTIPRHFAVDEPALPTKSNVNQGRMCQEMNGNKAKQEPNVNFVEDGKVGISSVQHLASKMIF